MQSAAIINKRGEVAIDLVIPVLLKDDTMSYIIYQRPGQELLE